MSETGAVGKYELVRKLAAGGMAEVYLARAAGPMGFEKVCVLKRILPHLAEDENFIQMFLAEARLAAQLNHPNVVQIFDFGESDGAYFLAMELIDGPSLRALYRRAAQQGRPLPVGTCAKIASFAAEGLAYAHNFADPATGEPLCLVHRDISPDNILLSRNGAVKVVDFGIAKAANQTNHTKTGTIKGKLAYMPPEQLQSKPLDQRVDVFALGMVLYELLTGMRPFDATSEVGIMQAILFEPLIPAIQRRPDLPPQMHAILDRALAKDRDQRYPDCRTLQHDLERFILGAGEPVGAFQIAALVKDVVGAAPAVAPAPPGQLRTPTSKPGAGSKPRPASQGAAQAPPPLPAAPAPAQSPEEEIDLLSMVAPAPVQTATEVQSEAPVRTAATVAHPGASWKGGQPDATAGGAAGRGSRLPWALAAAAMVVAAAAGGWIAFGARAFGPAQADPAPVAVASPVPVEAPAPVQPPAPAEPPAPAQPPAPVESPAPVAVAEVAPAPPEPAQVEKGRKSGRTTSIRTKTVATPTPTPTPTPAPTPAPVVVAAAAAPTLASFRVETSPQAQVKVNGRFVGVSPVQVSGIKPGEVEVEVYDSRLGLQKKERFSVAAGDNGARRIVAAPATLEFRVRPYATVYLNGRPLGQTPFDAVKVYEGTHSIRLVNDDLGKDVTLEYRVQPGANVIRHNLGG